MAYRCICGIDPGMSGAVVFAEVDFLYRLHFGEEDIDHFRIDGDFFSSGQ